MLWLSTVVADVVCKRGKVTPPRVASLTVEGSAFDKKNPADQTAVFWVVLDKCVVPAEHRLHHTDFVVSSCERVPVALSKIVVNFIPLPPTNASVLGPLTTNYPELATSLKEITISRNNYDESAELGAFVALATDLQELTFWNCGLNSVRGLDGRCKKLRRVDLRGCERVRGIEALADRVCLEEVTLAETSIASIEPLRTCPNLTTLYLRNCQQLSSIDALADHETLQHVDVAGTAISSIEALRTCPLLMMVDVSGCDQLPGDVSLPENVILNFFQF